MPDLNFQDISTVQSLLQPKPATFAAAATIAPTTFLTILTGNTAVTTITPPVTGTHMLAITPATTAGFAAGGNVVGGTATVAARVTLLVFNPITGVYTAVNGNG
jgi:hypothetical protein